MNDAMSLALDTALQQTGTHHGSSRWAEFRRCPRGHRLRYVDGLQLVETPDYFLIGQLVHAGLAYAALMQIENKRWRLSDLLDEAQRRRMFPPDVFVEGKRLLRAYFGQWGTDNAGYGKGVDLLEVEHFVASRKLKEKYTGRVDVLLAAVEKNTGKERLIIGDHKTASGNPSASDEELARKWSTRPQFLGLAYCVREIEGEVPCFMLNLIVKTRIPKFRRVFWDYTDAELDRWADEHNDSIANGTSAEWMNYSECVPWAGNPCWAFNWCHGNEKTKGEQYVLPTTAISKRRPKNGYKKEASA